MMKTFINRANSAGIQPSGLRIIHHIQDQPPSRNTQTTQSHAFPRRSLLSTTLASTLASTLLLLAQGGGVAAAEDLSEQAAVERLEQEVLEYYGKRDFAGALKLLDRLVVLQPDTPRWYEFRAAVRTDAKEFPGALRDYTVTLEMIFEGRGEGVEDRDFSRAVGRLLSGRALVYEGLSEWELALKDYDEALRATKSGGFEEPDPFILNAR